MQIFLYRPSIKQIQFPKAVIKRRIRDTKRIRHLLDQDLLILGKDPVIIYNYLYVISGSYSLWKAAMGLA